MAAQTRSAAEGLGLPVDDDPIGHDLKVANSGKPKTVELNGRTWHLGDGNTVSWINRNTRGGLAITSAIPPRFEGYATIAEMEDFTSP